MTIVFGKWRPDACWYALTRADGTWEFRPSSGSVPRKWGAKVKRDMDLIRSILLQIEAKATQVLVTGKGLVRLAELLEQRPH